KADDDPYCFRWQESFEARDDGGARVPLSLDWAGQHHSALNKLVAQISARGVALAALRNWRGKKQFAHVIIGDALSKSLALQSADRAFALDLFYGVLRNHTLLDFWIHGLRSARVDVDLRDLLRLGL